ncbi:MAG TPA: TraB/GumN family protein [Chlamydiales bacterium]|nr:TraB/GumN family protein [Chlamydiales bacterium]
MRSVSEHSWQTLDRLNQNAMAVKGAFVLMGILAAFVISRSKIPLKSCIGIAVALCMNRMFSILRATFVRGATLQLPAEVQLLATETAQLAEASPVALATRRHRCQSAIEFGFLTQVLEEITTQIERAPLAGADRFIYEVKYNRELVGYLIGTIHKANELMASDPVLHETVKKCKHVFFELGPKEMYFCKLWVQIFSYFYSMNCFMDGELMKTAVKNGIPCEGLESGAIQLGAFALCYFHSLESFRTSNPQVIERCQHLPEEREIAMFNGYQKRDAEEMFLQTSSMPKSAYDVLFTSRNQQWLYGAPNLMKRLKPDFSQHYPFSNPDFFLTAAGTGICTLLPKPVGIVVGVGHCLGSAGLVIQLRKAGFEVVKR